MMAQASESDTPNTRTSCVASVWWGNVQHPCDSPPKWTANGRPVCGLHMTKETRRLLNSGQVEVVVRKLPWTVG